MHLSPTCPVRWPGRENFSHGLAWVDVLTALPPSPSYTPSLVRIIEMIEIQVFIISICTIQTMQYCFHFFVDSHEFRNDNKLLFDAPPPFRDLSFY